MDQNNVNTGRQAVETVRTFLAEMGMDATEQSLPDGIAFHLALEGPADQGIAQVLEDAERFVFHFIFPGYVPPDRRAKVAEFVTRANWGLIEGNFELNMDTGALRYKVGIDFTYAGLPEPLVRNAMLSGMNNIELFAEALQSVIDGSAEPAAAVAGVSREPRPQ